MDGIERPRPADYRVCHVAPRQLHQAGTGGALPRSGAPSGALHRERVSGALVEAVRVEGLTVVSAPSGFGKTTAVAHWASTVDRVAWLSLSAADADPATLIDGIVNALAGEGERHGASLGVTRGPGELGRTYEQICATFDDAEAPVHLIVDDAHRAGERWRDGLLGMLAEQAPDGLRLVLVGTTLLELTLSRHRLTHPESFIGAETLAFTPREVEALGGGTRLDAEAIHEETAGWPIAVRLLQIGGARPDAAPPTASAFLGEYVRDHVLAVLPAEIAAFVVDGSACAELTADVAAAVTGRDDAGELLETCVRLGLFLDRFDGEQGPVYRWHPAFARRCADIARADSDRYAAVHRRAAGALESSDPLAAIAHALRAGDVTAARDTLLRHWLGLVVGASAAEVERTAIALLRQTPEDAEVLLVRACASDTLGDHRVARELFRRAEGAIAREGRGDPVVLRIARLFTADSRDDVVEAAAAVGTMLREEDDTDLGDRAALHTLLGWTELLHRDVPSAPIEYFSAAAREAEVSADPAMHVQTLGQLAFAQTWAGRFTDARETLRAVSAQDTVATPRAAYAGASAVAAAGFLAYWSAEDDRALELFGSMLTDEGPGRDFAAVARMMMAYTAAQKGDPHVCRRAAIGVQDIPLEMAQGIAWPALRESSIALLEEAAGRSERALRIARRYVHCVDLPVVNVALSGVFRRAGEVPLALEMLRSLRGFADVSYVKAATLITAAVLRRGTGHSGEAHELCEAAVAVAAGENIRSLFAPREAAVRRLLSEHIHVGSGFEDFIGRCLAANATGSAADRLSEREREVFQQLQTARTLSEIARELHVSINTVKTHQRAIYRKLGVSSRREAVHASV